MLPKIMAYMAILTLEVGFTYKAVVLGCNVRGVGSIELVISG